MLALVVLLAAQAAALPAADDCGAPKRLAGIDVSSWQGEIDRAGR